MNKEDIVKKIKNWSHEIIDKENIRIVNLPVDMDEKDIITISIKRSHLPFTRKYTIKVTTEYLNSLSHEDFHILLKAFIKKEATCSCSVFSGPLCLQR